MDYREVGRVWDENADVWTRLVRAGYDVYRDFLYTPAFLAVLPDVRGRLGLQVGCGEGWNTRRSPRAGPTWPPLTSELDAKIRSLTEHRRGS